MYESDDYDDEYEAMRAYYENKELPELTFKQLKSVRNQWEREYLRAKKLLWLCNKGQGIIMFNFSESISFEF